MRLPQNSGQQNSEAVALSIIKRAKKLGLDRLSRFSQSLKYFLIDPEDSVLQEILEEMISDAEMQELQQPDPFRSTNPLKSDVFSGDIFLGVIPTSGSPWLIPTELLTSHVLIVGRTGGGKTNLILLILAQLLERQKC